MKSEFSSHFLKKNAHISNFMRLCPVGTELFHWDGQMVGWTTDMAELIVTFCIFAKAPKNSSQCYFVHRNSKNKLAEDITEVFTVAGW